MKKNIKFWLKLIESQIEKWKEEQDNCNEGPILEEEYHRIKVLIWKIDEVLEKKL